MPLVIALLMGKGKSSLGDKDNLRIRGSSNEKEKEVAGS